MFQQIPPFQLTPKTLRDAIGQFGGLNAARRLHPAEPNPFIGTLDLLAVEKNICIDPCAAQQRSVRTVVFVAVQREKDNNLTQTACWIP
jgi:hypothetical protein